MARLVIAFLTLTALVACGSDTARTSDTATTGDEAATGASAAPLDRPTITPEVPPSLTSRPPTPTFVPTAAVAAGVQQPGAVAAPSPTAAPTPPPVVGEAVASVRLEDTAWSGGWRNSGGSVYGGRTATWVYGQDTPYHTMQASFDLPAAPRDAVQLVIEGMDDEQSNKTTIDISVNGSSIYAGPNPLPDDDPPLETGTWTTHTFPVDAALLRAGSNSISIRNNSPGSFGRPPFFMLDYADLSFTMP